MMNNVLLSTILVGVLVALYLVMPHTTIHAQEVTLARSIPYVDDGNPRHMLDVYAPQNPQDAPVLMFVSGGGWNQGSKDWVRNVGVTLAQQGVIVVIPDHRLVPDVTYQGQVEDLAAALAWIHDNMDALGGDPNRVIIGGHSAGAHLISLLALDPDYLVAHNLGTSIIAGVIPISGPVEIGPEHVRRGIIPDANPATLEKASPLFHVREGLPPFLLMYAEDDFPGMSGQINLMAEAIRGENVSVTVAEIAERDHFSLVQLIGANDDESTRVMLDWMEQVFTDDSTNEPGE